MQYHGLLAYTKVQHPPKHTLVNLTTLHWLCVCRRCYWHHLTRLRKPSTVKMLTQHRRLNFNLDSWRRRFPVGLPITGRLSCAVTQVWHYDVTVLLAHALVDGICSKHFGTDPVYCIMSTVETSCGQRHAKTCPCICGQRKPRSACASAQYNQGFHCPLTEPLETQECMNGELRPRWDFEHSHDDLVPRL